MREIKKINGYSFNVGSDRQIHITDHTETVFVLDSWHGERNLMKGLDRYINNIRPQKSYTIRSQICPYQVSLDRPFSELNYHEIQKWISENLSGYWYYYLQRTYYFEKKEDAATFKLAWS